jgi:hypothetical protein
MHSLHASSWTLDNYFEMSSYENFYHLIQLFPLALDHFTIIILDFIVLDPQGVDELLEVVEKFVNYSG